MFCRSGSNRKSDGTRQSRRPSFIPHDIHRKIRNFPLARIGLATENNKHIPKLRFKRDAALAMNQRLPM